jgi:hypothetical protein
MANRYDDENPYTSFCQYSCGCCAFILCLVGSIFIGGYSYQRDSQTQTAFAHLVCAKALTEYELCDINHRSRSGQIYNVTPVLLLYGPDNNQTVCGCSRFIIPVDHSICESDQALWLSNFYDSFTSDQCFERGPPYLVTDGIIMLSIGVLLIIITACCTFVIKVTPPPYHN